MRRVGRGWPRGRRRQRALDNQRGTGHMARGTWSMQSNSTGGSDRGNNFDTFRLIAASSVLFSHAFLISAGHENDEPFKKLLGEGYVLGFYGVVIFFIISGYLITKSWFNTANGFGFVLKRFLRIYPGLTICVVLSALVVAPVFSDGELLNYFTSWKYYDYIIENISLRWYNGWMIPGVFFYGAKLDFSLGSIINGSLWTIREEVVCYLLVLLLGLLRVLNLWTSVAILAASVVGFYLQLDSLLWPFASFKVLPAFSAGMTLYFVHRQVGLSGIGVYLCFLALVILAYLGHTLIALSIFGAYILVYLAVSPSVYMGNAARYGDMSYGVYLYGWPVEQCVRYGLGDGATWWSVFGLALPISFACGWLSWHLVERPTLRWRGLFKHRPVSCITALYSKLAGGQAAKTGVWQQEGQFLAPLMTRRQKIQYWIRAALLLMVLTYFWVWWLRPEHNIGSFSYVVNLLPVVWLGLLPLYFILIISRARVPAQLPVPAGYRVAMVVTKAPSEPFPIVRETLKAMLRQEYPHDTWLADEDPSIETVQWCREHGVRISTRKDHPEYHNKTWPRRAKCKEGNLAFFYDHYGYSNYDFVVQLDADHVPADGYLEEMLRGFADPKVGYVSAPSICDKNAGKSWSARARLYAEGVLHGPLQAGYAGDLAPLCFGSHYAVRTTALKQIGGLGPELAEDHSTTLMMNAHGWRGVHALNAIAHGAGPETFADLATQEFQWSRSVLTILLRYTPLYFGRLPLRLKLQFAFCQLWYPVFSIIMLITYLLPLSALLFDCNLVGINYPDFFARASLIWLTLTTMAIWWSKQQWTRPVDAKVVSWEGALFLFARWPWSLIGMLAAMRDRLMGNTLEFRVTPKGRSAAEPLSAKVLAPYAFLSIASGLPVLLLDNIKVAVGFYVFATINSLLYASLLVIIILKHKQENPRPIDIRGRKLYPATIWAVAVATIAVPLCAIPFRAPIAFKSMLWGYDRVLPQTADLKGAWRTITASTQPASVHQSARVAPANDAENSPLEATRSRAVAHAE